jgi:DNA-binding NtrC family response regulator
MTKILIVDDEPAQLQITQEVATKAGFNTITASNGLEALSLLRADQNIGAIILDLIMPNLDGMAVMEAMRKENIGIPIIIQTTKPSIQTINSAMRYGAIDYFVKPVTPERIIVSLQNALKIQRLQTCLNSERALQVGRFDINSIITKSPAMERVLYLAQKAAKSMINVLIEGETGVGKELVARAIVGSSERSGKSFISVNCGAISDEEIESVLFGHVKGGFAGANDDHSGKFEEAHGGTIFLDEVGELPQATQVKLLKVIQSGEIEPIGASKIKKVDVRIIAATNKRLLNIAKSGSLREDLYYRLNVFPIYVPPLRDRMEDIASLAEHFIAKFSAETGRSIHGISSDAMALLKSHDWPGNIGQFENAMFRSIVMAEEAWLQKIDFPQIKVNIDENHKPHDRIKTSRRTPLSPIHIDDAPLSIDKNIKTPAEKEHFLTENGEITPIVQIERELIIFAIKRYNGQMSKIARSLGIGRSTLYRKLKEFGLENNAEKTAA